ncbi:MAG: hypothetical protein LC650_02835, partial [Actinobacteria bacterium]|nr:hypothetical protein [Actinomycetota bacterium]
SAVEDPTDLVEDTYDLQVTDVNGCIKIFPAIVTIGQPAEISTTIASITHIDCFGDNTGAINIAAAGGTPPYNYSIDGGTTYQPEALFSGLSAGTYPISVKDAKGCEVAGDDVILTQPDVLEITGVVATDLTCNGDASGTITISATGGTTPYNYSINGGTTYQTNALFSGLSAGTYPISVTDANGCAATGTDVTITEPVALTVTNVEATNVTCNGDNNGTITITATGGIAPYQYSLNGSTFQAEATFSNLPPATYQIIVQDANGCTATETDVTITEPLALAVTNVEATNLTSNGADDGTITITAAGGTTPYQYSLDGTTFQSEATFTALPPGTYQTHVQDANGCTTTYFDVTITEPGVLAVSTVNATNITCNGEANGTITITATGGTEPYQYSLDGTTFQSEATFTALAPGTYQTYVKDDNDNTISGTNVTITEPAALAVSSVNATNVTCNGNADGKITITATGGATPYQYSLNGTTFQSEATFSNLPPGTYQIHVQDVNGCTATDTDVTITEPAVLALTNVEATNVTCNGNDNGTITITATGGTTPYLYSIDGLSYQSESNFSNLPPGTYQIHVQDDNGCTAIGTDVTITEPAALTVTNVEATNLTCNGDNNGTITIAATGGTAPYQYSIDGLSYQSESNFSNLPPATYQIHVQDANGCTVTDADVTITEPELLVVTVDSKTDLLCNGDDDGTITLSATGGIPPYEFSIDSMMTQTTDNVFTGLSAGEYDVFVIDDANCNATAGKVELTQPDALEIFVVSQTDITPSADGVVEMGASGGVLPYTFTLQPNGIVQSTGTFTFTEGEEGIYTV